MRYTNTRAADTIWYDNKMCSIRRRCILLRFFFFFFSFHFLHFIFNTQCVLRTPFVSHLGTFIRFYFFSLYFGVCVCVCAFVLFCLPFKYFICFCLFEKEYSRVLRLTFFCLSRRFIMTEEFVEKYSVFFTWCGEFDGCGGCGEGLGACTGLWAVTWCWGDGGCWWGAWPCVLWAVGPVGGGHGRDWSDGYWNYETKTKTINILCILIVKIVQWIKYVYLINLFFGRNIFGIRHLN